MAEYQVTSWRVLPSMVTAREGAVVAKVQLATRFQLAIDEAAMRLGDVDSDDYLAGWTRGAWTAGVGAPTELANTVVAQLDEEWPQARIDDYLESLR